MLFWVVLTGCYSAKLQSVLEPLMLVPSSMPVPADATIGEPVSARACGAEYTGLHSLIEAATGPAVGLVGVTVDVERRYLVQRWGGVAAEVQPSEVCYVLHGYRVYAR